MSNRRDYILIPQYSLCIEHFDDRYIVHHSNRERLNYSLAPIPTIHPSAIPKGQKFFQRNLGNFKPKEFIKKMNFYGLELKTK